MPHRFTDPTPTSLAGAARIAVFVASWEIECCAPPPVVGSTSTWTLEFVAAAPPFPVAEPDTERSWLVTPWPDAAEPGATRAFRLTDDRGIAAFWSGANGVPPSPGWTRLPGYLLGTVHGIGPDDFRRTTGVVLGIGVVSQHYVRGDGGWEPVDGTSTVVDRQRSPRWFTAEPRHPPAEGIPWVRQTGALLDLAVPNIAASHGGATAASGNVASG